MNAYAILASVSDRPGMLSGLTKVLADHQANISHVEIIHRKEPAAEIYFEFTAPGSIDAILRDLQQVPDVGLVEVTPSFANIYGKRIVIMGGGAQVGQVAVGAISEADRHNIRGERI